MARSAFPLPLVLIAPALGVANRWREKLPDGDPVTVFNYARNADAQIHRFFFEQMTRLQVDVTPPPARVTAIMGREDETVPFSMVEARWRQWEQSGDLAPGSQLIVIEKGGHALVDQAPLIEAAIVEAVR